MHKIQFEYNKLHFTWGCSILLLKKRKRALRPDSFDDSDIFLNILILIITSLAIHYSQNVFRGYSILVCIGVQVFFRGFIFHSSSRAWLALALALRLPPFDRKTLKNCASSTDPGLLNETNSSWFPLLCLSSYQNGWLKQTFFYNHINIQIRKFFSELVESNSRGKYSLIMIQIGMNTALLALSLGM